MSILMTGAAGFVAQHLAAHLKKEGEHVIGVDQWAESPIDGIEYHQADILDTARLSALLTKSDISSVYHLAAVSFLPDADATPRRALEINILGTVSLLDAVRNTRPNARLLIVGSSKEYGSNINSESLSEETHLHPTDFYGISKQAAETIGKQYASQFGLDVMFTRSFNHTGPGQSPRFVCSEWSRKVAEIEIGLSDPIISVGDLAHDVDFTDVRDVVRAYSLIVRKGKAGESYNVCSGSPRSLEYIMGYLRKKSSKEIRIEKRTQKLRAHRASPRLAGDHRKLTSHTGWRPEIELERTLDDLFGWWMAELGSPTTPD